MDVNIHGRNVKITQGLEDYSIRRIERLDRYLPNITNVRIDLANQKTRRGEDLGIAQITIRHRSGAILRAEEKSAEGIHAAIDATTDKLYRQIERFKGKRHRKGRMRFSASIEEIELAEPLPDYVDATEAIDELSPESEVVRRKTVQLEAMNEAEAIEQMELLGHDFFMFLNESTNQIDVLYRRSGGGYGILEPQA